MSASSLAQRHEYFKGKHAVKAILSPSYLKIHPSNLPTPTNQDEAVGLLHSIIPYAYFLRVDRSDQSVGGAKVIGINQVQMFHPDHFYAWLWEGSQLKTVLGGIAMVAVILAGVMFPLWPANLRVGVWYLSIGVLGLIGAFFVLAIVRLILYIITWFTASPGVWIFPNLFEDVGFVRARLVLYLSESLTPRHSLTLSNRSMHGTTLLRKRYAAPHFTSAIPAQTLLHRANANAWRRSKRRSQKNSAKKRNARKRPPRPHPPVPPPQSVGNRKKLLRQQQPRGRRRGG